MCECEKLIDAKLEAKQRQIEGLQMLIDSKFDAINLAVEKADAATKLRFQSVNEFRETLSDQTRTFVPRGVIDARFSDLERRIGSLENRLSVLDGRIIGWSAGVGAVVLLIALLTQYFGS